MRIDGIDTTGGGNGRNRKDLWDKVREAFTGGRSIDDVAQETGLSKRGFSSRKAYDDAMAAERRTAAGLPAQRPKTGRELAEEGVRQRVEASREAAEKRARQRQASLRQPLPADEEALDNNGLHFVTGPQYATDYFKSKNRHGDEEQQPVDTRPPDAPDKPVIPASVESVEQWRETYYSENERAEKWDAYLRQNGLSGYYSEEHFRDCMDYLVQYRTGNEYAKLVRGDRNAAYDANDPLRDEANRFYEQYRDYQQQLRHWDTSDPQAYAASKPERDRIFQKMQEAKARYEEFPIVLSKDTLSNPFAAKYADLLSIRGTYQGAQQQEYNRAREELDNAMSNKTGEYSAAEQQMAMEVNAALAAKVPGVAMVHAVANEFCFGLMELSAEQSRRQENDPARDQLHYLQSGAYIESANPDWVALVKIASAAFNVLTNAGLGEEVKEILRMSTGIKEKTGRLLFLSLENFGTMVMEKIANAAMEGK